MAGLSLASVLQQLRQIVAAGGAPASDGELLHRFVKDNEQTAFRELVLRHGTLVLGLCRRILHDDHLAEDVFQATFLVLARKAGGLVQWGSLASWLYTVAYRLALRSQAQQSRRRDVEKQVSDMAQVSSPPPAGWDELKPVLDAELARLSSKHRAPLILCYLQGKTNEQAARELGLPVSTLKTRLARGRALLRGRLERRGLALALAGTAAWADAAAAALPTQLLDDTLRTVELYAQGPVNVAGAVAPRPVLIAQGAVQEMYYRKLKVMLASFLLLGLAGGAGVLYQQSSAGDEPAQQVAVARDPVSARSGTTQEDKNSPRAKGRRIVQGLDKEIDELEIEPQTPLKDALALFSEKMGVPIRLNKRAFAEISIQDPDSMPVALPKTKNVRLEDLLQQVLDQVQGDGYGGAFVLRPSGIEVTTTYHQLVEALGHDPRFGTPDQETSGFGVGGFAGTNFGGGFGGLSPEMYPSAPNLATYFHELNRRMTPVVQVDLEEVPLREAVRQLSARGHVNIVIDPRVKQAAQQPVSLYLQNALLDTAINLLTEMADLDWVWIDKAIFITTPERAQARRERMREARTRAAAARQSSHLAELGLGNAETPAEPRCDVNASKQPLGEVLDKLAQSQGLNLVIDERVKHLLKTPVTLNVRNVKLHGAIQLLADLGGLGVTRVEGIYYVTSKENAKTLPDRPIAAPAPAPARAPVLPPPPNQGGGGVGL